ncbi:cytochrome oxidase maturation protein, cbb3-type [Mesorhizobium albiziae]|uniref:Cytochrome oxidase maturation protein, cbb3-type n=1 Tax=Neomesorhizobium albiziae TaxID=335020 RepID=A0A1I3ZP51_9HYPH|nr:cbb3-type cytochrome oxidase assembly protein CcoS [Mesorhizobium albiziae]GLS32284.1 cytochrome oxidase maturation protein, cbb3-type [Mesorhizobium albiziae]SFK45777.1 cytochrome oxidase maturation protein, cbb3-type [Mesorhizobium albiziae]
MTTLVYLIPVALFLGGLGLTAFIWALRSGQYDDLDGAAERVLFDPMENMNGPERRTGS